MRLRFRAQHLAGPPLETPEDALRLLVAVQSQDYPGAKWSLGQRVRGAPDAALYRAFGEGTPRTAGTRRRGRALRRIPRDAGAIPRVSAGTRPPGVPEAAPSPTFRVSG